MSNSPLPFLHHILIETRYPIEQSKEIGMVEFLSNDTLKRAFVRSLEIIGEAARNIPTQVQQDYNQVEWRAITGMRNRLVHEYFGVDYEIVWDVVVNKIPELHNQITRIIQQVESQ